MGSPGFVSVSLSKTGISCGSRATCLGSSIMLEAGVDAKLKEEGVELSRGEEVDDAGTSISRGGRYGLYGVSMGANGKRRVGAVPGPNKLAFVVGVDVTA